MRRLPLAMEALSSTLRLSTMALTVLEPSMRACQLIDSSALLMKCGLMRLCIAWMRASRSAISSL